MNSLSNGFLFLVGLTWLLCEVCLSASGGDWTPLWIYLAGFVVMFAVLGCLPLSTRTIETAGPIFSLMIGAGLLVYAVDAFDSGLAGGIIRSIGGLSLVALGILSFAGRKSSAAH